MTDLILLNKPYQVLCQFTDSEGRKTLADFVSEAGLYPAGRLDFDSEGLVILTGDGQLQHQISHPDSKLPKTYWVQLEGDISDDALASLRSGVQLKDGVTLPCKVKRIQTPTLWERRPPVRYRKHIPTCWIELILREGRNRQVRRMTAAVGFPTLRLVRAKIGNWSVSGLQPGQTRKLKVHSRQPPKPGAKRRRRKV